MYKNILLYPFLFPAKSELMESRLHYLESALHNLEYNKLYARLPD